MAVCGDKVCEAKTKACCESIIASICGDRGLDFPVSSCSAIEFVGTDDVSINQGECIDLTENVHAYDGNGNEIEFTVSPSEIPCCDTGEYEVTYSAVGISDNLVPTICLGTPMLHAADCGMAKGSVVRKITIEPYALICEATICCSSVMC